MKKKFSKKQIVIGVVGVLVFVVILGMIFGKPYPDKINLSDMTLNLEQEKDIKIKTTPSDANANHTSITKMIGHTSFGFTEKVYSHKDIDELRKAIDLL